MRIFKSSFSIAYAIYCILFCIIYLQGIFYTSGSALSQGLTLIYIAIGIYYLCKYVLATALHPIFLSILALFFIMLSITYLFSPPIVHGNDGPIRTLAQFKESCLFCLPIFIGYIIGLNQKIARTQILFTYILLLIVCIYRYYYGAELIIKQFNNDPESLTNNEAYNFVTILFLIPFIIKKYKIISALSICISIYYILYGAKRGAIVCFAIIILYYLYHYYRNGRISLKYIFISIAILFAAYYTFEYVVAHNAYLEARLDQTMEGNSSKRDYIIYKILAHYEDSNLLLQIFGKGTSQSVNYAGNFAHNDWLELLVDNGIIGVLIYFFFFVYLFKYANKKCSGNLKISLNIFGIYLLTRTLFSMGYTSGFTGIALLTIGVLVGNNELARRQKLILKPESDKNLNEYIIIPRIFQ